MEIEMFVPVECQVVQPLHTFGCCVECEAFARVLHSVDTQQSRIETLVDPVVVAAVVVVVEDFLVAVAAAAAVAAVAVAAVAAAVAVVVVVAAAVVALSAVVFLQVLVWANFWVGVLCLVVVARTFDWREGKKRRTVSSPFQRHFQRDTFKKDAPFFLAGPIFGVLDKTVVGVGGRTGFFLVEWPYTKHSVPLAGQNIVLSNTQGRKHASTFGGRIHTESKPWKRQWQEEKNSAKQCQWQQ